MDTDIPDTYYAPNMTAIIVSVITFAVALKD
jgi:hypothetical protein